MLIVICFALQICCCSCSKTPCSCLWAEVQMEGQHCSNFTYFSPFEDSGMAFLLSWTSVWSRSLDSVQFEQGEKKSISCDGFNGSKFYLGTSPVRHCWRLSWWVCTMKEEQRILYMRQAWELVFRQKAAAPCGEPSGARIPLTGRVKMKLSGPTPCSSFQLYYYPFTYILHFSHVPLSCISVRPETGLLLHLAGNMIYCIYLNTMCVHVCITACGKRKLTLSLYHVGAIKFLGVEEASH